jgi:hypothetical protein
VEEEIFWVGMESEQGQREKIEEPSQQPNFSFNFVISLNTQTSINQIRQCLDPFKLPKILQDSPSH